MEAVLAIFADIDDPRDHRTQYELPALLFMALAATLCGAPAILNSRFGRFRCFGCDREGCEWTGIRRRSGRSEIGRGDGLKQMGPVLKDHVSGDRPQVLEEAVCGAAGGDRLSPG